MFVMEKMEQDGRSRNVGVEDLKNDNANKKIEIVKLKERGQGQGVIRRRL